MTIGIDGLVSGLNTTSIIDNLMQIESAPQTLLKTKQTSESSLVSALQALNSELSALGTKATTASTATSWNAFSGTADASSVTVTTDSTAQTGSLQFQINQLAQSQTSLLDPTTLSGQTSLTFQSGSTYTTITPASMSPADIASAINSSSASPVTANLVSNGSGSYVLQLASKNTGAANAFSVYAGTVDATTPSPTSLAMTAVKSAQDASITLYPGSSAATTVTNASNTFTGLESGVNVTVSKVETNPVTVTVARNNAALTTMASDLVTALNTVLNDVSAKTASTTSTDATTGAATVTGGVLSGDSLVRDLQESLQEAGSYPVNGFSPNDVGITFTRDGNFTFDSTAFANALASDPAKVQSIVSTLAGRVAAVTNTATDSVSGTLTQRITSEQKAVTDLGTQISDWDTRLADRRATLQAQFTALEVAMSEMKSQQQWLTSQLGTLSSSSSTSSSSG